MKKKEQLPEPEVDESVLTEEQKEGLHPPFPWKWAIFVGVVLTLIVVCFLVIYLLGGPTDPSASSSI